MQKTKIKKKNLELFTYTIICCAVLLFTAIPKAESVDLNKLQKSLYATVCQHKDDWPYRKIKAQAEKAIDSLFLNGTDESLDILGNYLVIRQADGKLKQSILKELGKLGTQKALQQYNDFEEWAKGQTLNDNDFYFGFWDYPAHHFQPQNLTPVATCKKDGITWAIFIWKRFGSYSLWLTKSVNEVNWDSPFVVNPPQLDSFSEKYFKKCKSRMIASGDASIPFYLNEKSVFKLSQNKDVFYLKINKYKLAFTLDDIKKDSDNDGLTDDAEKMIFTNPYKVDTDEDSIIDGVDSNPLTKKHSVINDTILIRQAAFNFYQTTLNSCNAIILRGDSSAVAQEYYGYRGFVLKGKGENPGFVQITIGHIKINNENAEVGFSDYEGPMAASGCTIYLKKMYGSWYVVKTGNGWIS